MVRLSPRRAAALVTALESVVMDVEEEDEDADGVGDFLVVLQAYPRPGTEAGAPS
jgi:hypothetical protein